MLLLPQRYIFSSKSQHKFSLKYDAPVVVATTKVHIFKQITTAPYGNPYEAALLLLPQRYIFSSKSQLVIVCLRFLCCCCCYHKGTYFQANHNTLCHRVTYRFVVVATTKVHIFKQITTAKFLFSHFSSCCCYHKGTYFQANHNAHLVLLLLLSVVVATTKVHIFKQITTNLIHICFHLQLLLLPQRYIFSSKSQPFAIQSFLIFSCCCYHKGTYFQANHNYLGTELLADIVVVATTKVHIFKQITTDIAVMCRITLLLLLPQRYIFSSKSQLTFTR